MSTAITLADAVKDHINAGTYTNGFTPAAKRQFVVKNDLKALGDLTVSVVPTELSASNLTRQMEQIDISIDCAVQQRVSKANDAAAIDKLMTFVEEIRQHVRRQGFAAGAQFTCLRSENPVIFDMQHLDKDTVFTSVLRFTFRGAQ